MLMFHGNLVHGSVGYITPYQLKIVYLTLNAVSNYIRTPIRAEFIAHRDFTPINSGRRLTGAPPVRPSGRCEIADEPASDAVAPPRVWSPHPRGSGGAGEEAEKV